MKSALEILNGLDVKQVCREIAEKRQERRRLTEAIDRELNALEALRKVLIAKQGNEQPPVEEDSDDDAGDAEGGQEEKDVDEETEPALPQSESIPEPRSMTHTKSMIIACLEALGPSTAKAVAENTSIPFGTVYQALKSDPARFKTKPGRGLNGIVLYEIAR